MQQILQDTSEYEIVRAVENNALEYAKLHRILKTAEFYEGSDMTRLIIPDAPNPFLNGVWRAHFFRDRIDDKISETLAQFSRHSVPMLWWIDSTTYPPNLASHLQARGLGLLQQSGMAIDLRDLNSRYHGGYDTFEIRRVDSVRRFAHWLSVNVTTFGFPETVGRTLSNVFLQLGFADTSCLRHYVGYAGATPVTSSSLFLGAGVAGIYNVATVPEERGKGFGTAITLRPLLDARSMGYRIGVLTASKMGARVYSKLGFKEYATSKAYLFGDRRLIV